MKQIIFLFLIYLIFCPIIMAQTIVIDSVKWVSFKADEINAGKKDCKHEWILSAAYNGDETGTYHLRKAVCSLCGRCEIQKQKVYNHEIVPKKTIYEAEKEKLIPSYMVTNEEIKMDMLNVLEVSGAIIAVEEKVVEEPIKEEPIVEKTVIEETVIEEPKIEIEPVIEPIIEEPIEP